MLSSNDDLDAVLLFFYYHVSEALNKSCKILAYYIIFPVSR